MRPAAASVRWRILALANAADRRRRLINQRRKSRALLRINVDAFDLPEAEFIKTFRLGKEQVRALIQELTPYLSTQRRRDGISNDLKVLITLALYATGSYQTLVGQSVFHNVAQTTVSRSVRQVTDAINKIYSNHIKWPMLPQERNAIKAQFYHRFGIPGVLGCIDGTQVAIIRPVHHEERFFNRKGYHSLNVMIICDSELNILCMDASSPGSAHDSMVWQGHPLSRHLTDLSNNGEQVFLLGDSGYPLRATMMTPILNTREGSPEHYYYQHHVTARNVVERCIGVLKARFRCLLVARALHYNPITAAKIVNACCVLHNIANQNRAPLLSLTPAEAEDQIGGNERLNPQNRRVNPELLRGRELQQSLVERLWRERLVCMQVLYLVYNKGYNKTV
ncbi:hypothetical protein ABMA27_014991 [Loxostege sticticalis]|uniref:Putative nuclease HARBI1 n=1 Tax=Loxostege sticticalis TaxID=481309 RepID=A0ABR3IAW2_LOXSC